MGLINYVCHEHRIEHWNVCQVLFPSQWHVPKRTWNERTSNISTLTLAVK